MSTSIKDSFNTGKMISNITGNSNYIGGIVGNVSVRGFDYYLVYLENCYNLGNIEANEGISGGIIGYEYAWSNSNTIQINRCYNKGKVSNSNGSSGGITGENNVYDGIIKIRNSYNTGDIEGTIYCGGISGIDIYGEEGSISTSNCYNAGNIIGKNASSIGGIKGIVDISPLSYYNGSINNIINCYNLGNIVAENVDSEINIGGIVAEIVNLRGFLKIENSNNSGHIQVTNENVGGIIGVISSTNATNTITNNYYNNQNVGGINGKDITGSAEFTENMPNILEIIGDMFESDSENQNEGNPILKKD